MNVHALFYPRLTSANTPQRVRKDVLAAFSGSECGSMPSPCGLAIPSFLKRWGSKKFSGCPRAASRRWQYAHQGFAGFKAVILRGGLCPGGTISHTGVLPVFAFQPCEARCMKHVPRGLRTDQLGTACESRLTAEAFRPARPRARWHSAPSCKTASAFVNRGYHPSIPLVQRNLVFEQHVFSEPLL